MANPAGRKIFMTLVMTVLLAGACDDEPDRIIPYVPVSFFVDLNIVNDLNVAGNSVYFAGPGYSGVLIYCAEPYQEYYAFDAACTYDFLSGCKVRSGVKDTNPGGPIGTCSCCGSQFLLMGGASPVKGPATYSLQQYHVSVMNNTLRVYN